MNSRKMRCLCFMAIISAFQASATSDATKEIALSVGVVGQTVTLKCSLPITSPPRWYHIPVRTLTRKLVFNGHKISINSSTTINVTMTTKTEEKLTSTSELTIRDVKLDQSGTYRCSAWNEDEGFLETELVVLASSPVCQDSRDHVAQLLEEFSEIKVDCHVGYSGSIHPSIQCMPQNLPSTTTSSFDATYKDAVQVTRSLNDKHISCELHFPRTPSNPLKDRFRWLSFPLSVRFGPEQVSVNSLSHLLVCSAVGNPTPTFTWTQRMDETDEETDGAEFNVCNSSLAREWRTNPPMDAQSATLKAHTFQCTAKSGDRNVTQKYSLMTSYIWMICGIEIRQKPPDVKPQIESPETVDGGSGSNATFIVAVTVVIVTVLVCGVVIASVFIASMQRSRQQPQVQQPPTASPSIRPPPINRRRSWFKSIHRGPLSAIYDEINEAKIRGSGINHYLDLVDDGAPIMPSGCGSRFSTHPPMEDICEYESLDCAALDIPLQSVYNTIEREKKSVSTGKHVTCDGGPTTFLNDVIGQLQQLRSEPCADTDDDEDEKVDSDRSSCDEVPKRDNDNVLSVI